MLLRRAPVPALRPFVAVVWASDDGAGTTRRVARERVLPTGAMHVVFRLSSEPLRLFDGVDAEAARAVGHAVVGGARATCYVRDVSTPSRSVGAMLHPGAARLLFGGSAAELSGQHTRLDDLWGRSAELTRERLLAADGLEQKLRIFESLLLERLPRVRALHPAVADALGKLAAAWDVRHVVAETGYSHRRFIDVFEDAVGLTPKRYARVQRFRRVLDRMTARPDAPLVEIALTSGFADQAHFSRDFLEITGISPLQYRSAAPVQPHHVPIR